MRTLRNTLLLALVMVAILCHPLTALAQIRVSPSGPPMGDGSSWSNPLPADKLQQKIDDGGTDFWLSQGSYPTLHLRAGTTIEGGYSGSLLIDGERDPAKYITTINGVFLYPYYRLSDGTVIDGNNGALTEYPTGGTTVDGCTLLEGANTCSIICAGAKSGAPTFTNCILEGTPDNFGLGVWAAGSVQDSSGSG